MLSSGYSIIIYLIFDFYIRYTSGAAIFTNCLAPTKQILLSFDDGPDVATDSFVNTMNAYGIKGLFFINGIKVMKNNKQATVKSMYNSGHVFGTHTYSHPELTGLNDFNIRREFLDNELDVFRKIFNNRPYLVRAPYFSYNARVSGLYDEFGYVEVDASFESTDWQDPENATRVIEVIKSKINTGNSFINLIHEHISSNVNVLPQIIPYAFSKGYTFVNPMACLGLTYNYQSDNFYGPNLNNGVPGY